MESHFSSVMVRGEENFQFGFALANFPQNTELLHQKELIYYQNLPSKIRQQSYLLGRVAAKGAIAQLHPHLPSQRVYISQGVFDFPVVNYEAVVVENTQVSISHCKDVGVALAFGEEHPMGIDIEEIDAEKQSAMQSQMTEEDLSFLRLNNKNSIEGLTIIWCMKEALSKILKTGLMIDFKLLSLRSLVLRDNSFVATFEHFPQYQAIGYNHGDYACAIALPQKTSINVSHLELAIRNIVL